MRDPLSWLTRRAPRDRWLVALAALAWGIGVALFATRAWGRALDDFFITYRYAANLAAGHGLAFNPGERVLGTTAPGFAVLLAAGHLATGIDIPGLGTLSTAAALWLLALIVLRELAAAGRRVEGLVAGTLVALSSFAWPQHGSEIPTALLFLLVAARRAAGAPLSAGALAALAAWCRPECALGALLIAGLEVARERRLPLRYLAAFAGSFGAAALFDLWATGALLPSTLAAKRAQSEWMPAVFVSGGGFWSHSLRQVVDLGFGAATALVLALGIAGLPLVLRLRGPACRILMLQAAALAVAYPLLGVADYPWYAIPFVLALSVAAPVAGGALVRQLLSDRELHPWAARLAAAIAAAGLLLPPWLVWPGRVGYSYDILAPNSHHELYRRTGEWLRANTPAGATVGYVEVGTIAYFSERSVQDLLGLVTPRNIAYVPTGDMVGAFLTGPPDYYLYNRNLIGFLDPARREPWFTASYRKVAQLDSTSGSPEHMVIYARRPGSVLPAPRPPLSPTPPAETARVSRQARDAAHRGADPAARRGRDGRSRPGTGG